MDLHNATRVYFGKPGDKVTLEALKKNGENVNQMLSKVFDAVKPTAKFQNPNFNSQPRIASLEEMENLSQKIKDKINQIDSYQSLDEDSLCDTTSSASSELATFAELVFFKANESGNPNLIEKIKRNLSILPKELTTRNQSLVEKTNKQVESPEDENNGNPLFIYFYF